MIDSPAAREFVVKILSETGTGESLDEETRETLIVQLLEQLTEMVNSELIDSLNQHQLRQVEHLLDAKQEANIEPYLKTQGISNHEIIARAMRRFQLEYLGN